MKVFGKEVGKAIKIPPIIKQLKKWLRRGPNNDSPGLLTMPSADRNAGNTVFELSVAMPGLDKNEVKVELQGNTLVISGEKERSQEVKEKHWERRELIRSTFHRAFDVPLDVDPESIHATMKNGLLQVHFSKRETKYKRILKVA